MASTLHGGHPDCDRCKGSGKIGVYGGGTDMCDCILNGKPVKYPTTNKETAK